MVKDQAEADEDMSLKQRLVLAGGSALSGGSEMVDNEVLAAVMEVGGERCEHSFQLLLDAKAHSLVCC